MAYLYYPTYSRPSTRRRTGLRYVQSLMPVQVSLARTAPTVGSAHQAQ